MPKSNYFHQAKLTPEQEKRRFNPQEPQVNDTDLNIHLKAREYLMLMQAVLSSHPQIEYRDLWQIQVFIHNLITESEREYLAG
ncbi:hypothetical protein VA7868_04545 [Vibrio aerogenes CECT 7868]|uniref:Uncharacterized protein n=1 Tax=Vibrio aerogenes CECT 7868 TaxID=1216006 RepID=A0A1M6EYC0_9VIBR|nr:hypothetical protein [Vibrio aerogenes]SHI90391.1 hypothetical protein VA7868_04545 [Vibrio aerogenes CECT 7868]